MKNSFNLDEFSREDKKAIEQISTEQAELLVDPGGESTSGSTKLIVRIIAGAIATGVGIITYKNIHERSSELDSEDTPTIDDIAHEQSESFMQRHPGLTTIGAAAVAATIATAVYKFNQYKEEKDQEE